MGFLSDKTGELGPLALSSRETEERLALCFHLLERGGENCALGRQRARLLL